MESQLERGLPPGQPAPDSRRKDEQQFPLRQQPPLDRRKDPAQLERIRAGEHGNAAWAGERGELGRTDVGTDPHQPRLDPFVIQGLRGDGPAVGPG
jgi:hypothetical protein